MASFVLVGVTIVGQEFHLVPEIDALIIEWARHDIGIVNKRACSRTILPSNKVVYRIAIGKLGRKCFIFRTKY
jgi:hypothetical protein